jgi:hypothetical protein
MAVPPAHAHHAPAPLSDADQASCHAPADDGAPLCASHCSQGDLSKEAPPLSSVPALGQLPMMPVVAVKQLTAAAGRVFATTPRVAWHRPTPHPASLLLI